MLIGYARISTTLQTFDTQVGALIKHGVDKRNIYQEQISGAAKKRPELEKALGYLIKGDTFVVCKLDRLGRSVEHLIELSNWFKSNEINFISLSESLDFKSAAGKMQFQTIAMFAEFERNRISERTLEGHETARRRGSVLGRRPVLNEAQKELIDRLVILGKPKKEIARSLGLKSRTPVYNYLNKKGGYCEKIQR